MGITAQYKHISLPTLEKLKQDQADMTTHWYSHTEGYLDIDKAWYGIHFLLTGTAYMDSDTPLGRSVMGNGKILSKPEFMLPDGVDISEEDLALEEANLLGATYYLLPEEVKETADVLATISKEEFTSRFHSRSREDEIIIDDLEYLLYYYNIFVPYYQEAAEQYHAMLIMIG